MKVLLIDIDKCNGCYNCQIACKDEHVGNDWPPIAKPQPDTGQFWLKLNETVQGSVPKVRVRYMQELCQHCDDAPCLKSCKEGAIYKRDDGPVIINPESCTGCRDCMEACPYKVIYFNSELCIAQKCTMCAHLLDKGWREPRCVDACPTGAMVFGEEDEMKELLSDAELLHPEYGTRPRVYYKCLPNKFFIAGAVFDPVADEVLEGVSITLTNQVTGAASRLKTDFFGDFWFERQKPGSYSLSLSLEGYLPATVRDIQVTRDINIGDIELHKGRYQSSEAGNSI